MSMYPKQNNKNKTATAYTLYIFLSAAGFILVKKIILQIWVVIKAIMPAIKYFSLVNKTSPKKEPNNPIITNHFPFGVDSL